MYRFVNLWKKIGNFFKLLKLPKVDFFFKVTFLRPQYRKLQPQGGKKKSSSSMYLISYYSRRIERLVFNVDEFYK